MEELNQQDFTDYAKKMLQLTLVDLDYNPYRPQESIVGKYTKQNLKRAIEAPELDANQRILRRISKYAYNVSMHYMRLCHYFPEMLLYYYYVDPYNVTEEKLKTPKFKRAYLKALERLESMSLRHELLKVMQYVFRDGVFYGYVWEDEDDFFLQALDADYCKILSINRGTITFAFNINYFYVYPERLKQFPPEFTALYNDYRSQNKKVRKNSTHWVPLNPENTACFKFDEHVHYVIPPFIPLFASILDIQDFKDLDKNKSEIDNYKMLALEIPLGEKDGKVDNFLISAPFVEKFGKNIKGVVPQQVGVATTPMKVTPISFERDKVDKNKVSEATAQFFDESGVSKLLFTSDNTSIGLNNSIRTDESIAFSILRQFERWVSLYLRKYTGNIKLHVIFLDITHFNKKDVQDQYQRSATFGAPKAPWFASLGMSPASPMVLSVLEEDVMKLNSKLKPLQSSHTQSGDQAEGLGRPQKDESDLSEKGLEARDKLTSETRAQ